MVANEESRLWAVIAWALLIIGAVIALLLKPKDDYVRYWAIESLGFTAVVIIAYIIILIFSVIFGFTAVIPTILYILYYLGVFLAWIIGVFKALMGDKWRPPIIHDMAEFLRHVLSL